MKDVSEKLSIFLKNNIVPRIKNKFPKTMFSNECKKFIGLLFNQIFSANEILEKTNTKTEEICKNMNCDDFPKGNNYELTPNEIKEYILNMEKSVYLSEKQINGKTINLHLICKKNKTIKFINSVTKKIFLWLSIALQYSPKKCSQNLDIYLYFTDLEKSLPKRSEIIKEINANTAFTTFCKPSTEIIIFREEEWFKVFIHESFHCLGLDFSEFDNNGTNKKILSIFPVSSDVRIFETYCEMWAEILNVMFMVFFSTRITPSINDYVIDKMIFKTETYINEERIFSLFQCVKVLEFYGMDYCDLYEKNEKSHIARLYRYKENTQVLSYYILKSIYMFYVDDFIEWCIKHNNYSLNFNKSPKLLHRNMDEYCNFIQEHYNRSDFVNNIKSIEKWYENINPNIMRNSELQTLRMTLYEF
jgi:hypothetical protein